MSNDIQTIKDISKQLGEPDFFLMQREKAFEAAKLLPKKPYGIGIYSSLPVLDQQFEEMPASYHYKNIEGVRVLPWKDAMKDIGIISSFETYVSPLFPDHFFANSFAGFGDGLVIIAEEGSNAVFELSTVIEKSGSDFIGIIAEENSVLRIFESATCERSVFFGRNIFVFVKKGAKVTFAETADIFPGSSYFSNKFSHVLENGKMEWNGGLHSGAEVMRFVTRDVLAESGAEVYAHNGILCSGESFDIYHTVQHEANHTFSHLFARGIAGGGGKILYRALSDITSGIVGAMSRQDGRFLITSSGAEVDAIPSLDIGSSESNSSHALSISHLQEHDFFYPALRGIAPYHASAMLLSGFLAKSLEKLPQEWEVKFLEKIHKKLSSPLFHFD